MLLFGGPTNRAPSTELRRSSAFPNAASPPSEPRLSPKTTSLGRVAAGIVAHLAWTASNSALPADFARSMSTMNEIQLGRYEYCMLTSAVSPL